MPGRKYQASATSNYRYSINGQEKSDELNENLTTALYWEYDSRIGRRWNIDPKPNISVSPYVVLEDNPIFNIDPLGDKIKLGKDSKANDKYISMLNSLSGNTYKIKKGVLKRVNKVLNNKSDENKSASLSKKIEDMIKDGETHTLNIVDNEEGDNRIRFDNYNTREIDMRDFNNLNNNIEKAVMTGHYLEEYSSDPKQLCNAKSSEFDVYHDNGNKFENKIASEMTKTNTTFKFDPTRHISKIVEPNTNQVTGYNYMFDFGTFKFNVVFNSIYVPFSWKGSTRSGGGTQTGFKILKASPLFIKN